MSIDMHPDTILMIAKETRQRIPIIAQHTTALIHLRGFARIVAVDSQDNNAVQLTTDAANTIRAMYGVPLHQLETAR